METSVSRSETVDKLRFAADAAFAMLAGMQLDFFLDSLTDLHGKIELLFKFAAQRYLIRRSKASRLY